MNLRRKPPPERTSFLLGCIEPPVQQRIRDGGETVHPSSGSIRHP
jgi:hypothetical protein